MRYDYYYLTIQNNKTAATFCLPACVRVPPYLCVQLSRSRLLTLFEDLKNLCSLYLLFSIAYFPFFFYFCVSSAAVASSFLRAFCSMQSRKKPNPDFLAVYISMGNFLPLPVIFDWFFHFPPFLFVLLRMSLFSVLVQGQLGGSDCSDDDRRADRGHPMHGKRIAASCRC